MAMPSAIAELTRSAVNLVFPPQCALCGDPEPIHATRFCAVCAESIEQERRRAYCPTCAKTLAPFEQRNERCGECALRRPKVRGMVRVAAYRSGVYELLLAFKFKGREELSPLLCGWLAESVGGAPWLGRIDCVVSVPTHWRRRWMQPVHVASTLGAQVSCVVGLPHRRVLRRTRAGAPQLGLPHAERLTNVVGAFALRRGVEVQGLRVLLVDDVRTTGATLNECAKMLTRAGAAEVFGAVVARAGTHEPGG